VKVFLSYRRQDSEPIAGRMADFLAGIEDVESVFYDYDAIGPGENFVAVIDQRLAQATHVFVLIGPKWAGRDEASARARIFDDADMVQREVRQALSSAATVVPILLDDMRMPGPAELPASLRPLAQANGYQVRNARFRQDMAALLRRLLGRKPEFRAGVEGAADPAWRLAMRAGLGALAGFAVFLAASAVMQYGFGLTSAQLFESIADEETARILWRLVLVALVLAGALAPFVVRLRRGP
jgi:TIR domain